MWFLGTIPQLRQELWGRPITKNLSQGMLSTKSHCVWCVLVEVLNSTARSTWNQCFSTISSLIEFILHWAILFEKHNIDRTLNLEKASHTPPSSWSCGISIYFECISKMTGRHWEFFIVYCMKPSYIIPAVHVFIKLLFGHSFTHYDKSTTDLWVNLYILWLLGGNVGNKAGFHRKLYRIWLAPW